MISTTTSITGITIIVKPKESGSGKYAGRMWDLQYGWVEPVSLNITGSSRERTTGPTCYGSP